jgi:phosphomevalonate kinase
VCCSIDRVKSRGSGENDWLVLVESIKEVDRRRSLRHQQPNPTTSRAIDYVILGTFRRHGLDGWMRI